MQSLFISKFVSRGVHWTPALMILFAYSHNFWCDENCAFNFARNAYNRMRCIRTGEHGSPLHFNIHTKTGCTQSVQPVALWLSCAATACSDIILIYLSTLWTLPNIGLSWNRFKIRLLTTTVWAVSYVGRIWISAFRTQPFCTYFRFFAAFFCNITVKCFICRCVYFLNCTCKNYCNYFEKCRNHHTCEIFITVMIYIRWYIHYKYDCWNNF